MAVSRRSSGHCRPSQNPAFWTQGNQGPTVIHGVTWLPDSVVDIREPLNAAAGGVSIFMGGIYAQGIIVDTIGNITGAGAARMSGTPVVPGSTTVATRTTLVCATASPAVADGTAPTIAQAAVILNANSAIAPVLESWREVQSATC